MPKSLTGGAGPFRRRAVPGRAARVHRAGPPRRRRRGRRRRSARRARGPGQSSPERSIRSPSTYHCRRWRSAGFRTGRPAPAPISRATAPARSPRSARSPASTNRPSESTSGSGDPWRSSSKSASTRRWRPSARWQSIRTGCWSTEPVRPAYASRLVQRRLPVALVVLAEAEQLAGRRRVGHGVHHRLQDPRRVPVALALGTRRSPRSSAR